MSSRNLTKDEIIAVWLQREFERNWRFVEPVARRRLPELTQAQIKSQIVDNPIYTNIRHNFLRFIFLSSFRISLLRPVCNGNWVEKELNEREFQELRVINRDLGWMYLSKPDGRLSTVAERVISITSTQNLHRDLVGVINAIDDIKRGQINEKLFLIGSEDSDFITILEGNKSAVGMYIKYFLERNVSYESKTVFYGHLEAKSFWQW